MSDRSPEGSALRASPGRILLVCPEPLGHSHPAGVGIRFIEIAAALRDEGHQVTVLSPDGGAIDGCRAEKLSPESIVNSSRQSDVAVIQGHVANDFFAHASEIPSVVDLYDPWIVENFHYHRSHGPEVFEHDRTTLLRSIEAADMFLCASYAQRLFYAGLFLATGRLTPVSFDNDPELLRLIRIVPFGVPPPRTRLPSATGHRILFGGIYDWYDPIAAIEAVVIARASVPDMTLTFSTHPNPETTPQGKTAAARELVRSKGYEDFILFEPWVAYRDREAYYDRFSMALITFPPSLETDLSMRTRIFDYLWAGLPVVSSPAPGTDEVLRRYRAGSILHSGRPEDFGRELVRILSDSSSWDAMQRGTQQYARDHQWRPLLEPLLEFCRHPTRSRHTADRQPLTGVERASRSVIDRIRTRLGGRT